MISDMKTRIVAKEDVIQEGDDSSCSLYVVLKGTVQIFERVSCTL